MRVDVFGSEPKDLVNARIRKFVLANDGKEAVLTVSRPGRPENHEHKDLLQHGRTLVGAGDISSGSGYEDGYEVEWNSYSCRTRHGYDRPFDKAEANRVLLEIRNRIAQWDKDMSQ